MTARIVIFATITARDRIASFHRESPIAGYPDCGSPLRRPHRAIAIGDDRLCRQCWGDVEQAVAS